MNEIEQIIASNVGNRLTRELAIGIMVALTERVDAMLREAQKSVEVPPSEG